MSDREKAVRRMGESLDLPPEVVDEFASRPPSTRWTEPFRWAEPVCFPAPRDPSIADRVEATAEQIQVGFPYRTLLDCRQLAARLVDEVLTWDAMWPEAEGDCSCTGPSHRFGCVWDPGAETL